MEFNWSAVAAICSMIGVVVTIAVGAYQSGKLSQKICDHDEKFTEQAKTNTYINEKISEHDRNIARLDGRIQYPCLASEKN
jgi:hypothetical protein